jgi:hypothetical protein
LEHLRLLLKLKTINTKTTLDKLIHTIKKVQAQDFITQERLSKAKDLVINEYKNLAIIRPNLLYERDGLFSLYQ